MSARSSPLRALYLYELRTLLRDRRAILASVVLPVAVLPLVLFSSSLAERGREERQQAAVLHYAIAGSALELARELIAEGTPEDAAPRLEELASEDPAADLERGALAFYLETFAAGEVPVPEGEEADPIFLEGAGALPELPHLRLVFKADRDASSSAAGALRERLVTAREERRARALAARGFPVDQQQVATLVVEDVASAAEVTGSRLGRFATLFAMIFLLTGGAVVAADTLAGEKERGTLETLLTSAATRGEIVWAKQALILTVGVVIVAIQLLSLWVYTGLEVIEVGEGFAVELSAATAFWLLLFLLPLAALVSSLLLLLSGLSKSYKEFQLYFFPLFLGLALPAAAAVLPALELRSAVVLVPIAGVSVAVRDVLSGQVDPPFLLLAWAVNAAVTLQAARWASRTLSSERLVTSSELDRADLAGGPELFERRVLRAFALMWVAVFLTSATTFAVGGLRLQLTFNLLVVLLGGSLWLIRRYRLDPRTALALRPARPAVWLAVLLGAPCGFLTGIALGALSFQLFPVPREWLESFGEMLAPADVAAWEVLLWVALLPGICEELAFRGVLLHGLRRRLPPLALALATAAAFALFHFQLARLLPTLWLGFVAALLTLATGSIFPAMAWHALNNAAALTFGWLEVDPLDLPPAAFAAGVAGTALALGLVWRLRTPYPGLRGRRRAAGSSGG